MKTTDFLKNWMTRKYIIMAILALLIVVVIVIIVKKRKEKGLLSVLQKSDTSIEEQEALNNANNTSSAIRKTATISEQQAANIAQTIKDAWGYFNDDEDAIFEALRGLKNTSDWLMVVSAYGTNSRGMSDRTLKSDLKARLSSEEYQCVVDILSAKGITI